MATITPAQRQMLERIVTGQSPYKNPDGSKRHGATVSRLLHQLCDKQMIGLNPGWVIRPAGRSALLEVQTAEALAARRAKEKS